MPSKKSAQPVTAPELRRLAAGILKPELGRGILRDSLAQKAGQTGVHLEPAALEEVLQHVHAGIQNAGAGLRWRSCTLTVGRGKHPPPAAESRARCWFPKCQPLIFLTTSKIFW